MDRISNLPDEILCQILSFFPTTKEAASTSLLSKRWRNLFAFSPDLCICYVDSILPRDVNIYRSFIDFVDRVLVVPGNSQVKKLSLSIQQSVAPAHIKRWIINVVSRGIFVLDLDLITISTLVLPLPLEIFTCKTLVKLKLGLNIRIAMIPENASLPALKTLFLCNCSMLFSACNFQALLFACLALEELTLLFPHCWDQKQVLTVSFPILKRLTISCTSSRGLDSSRHITFDIPRLAYLDYSGYVPYGYPNINIHSLVEANISFVSIRLHLSESGLKNLIKELRNVEILNLSSVQTSKIFYSNAEAIPLFKNLTRLSITIESGSCLKLVAILLKSSPILETLVIKGPLHWHFYDEYDEESKPLICECLSEYSFTSPCTVKVLKITEYNGTCGELEQMKHFLGKMHYLKLVKVWSNETDPKEQLRLTNDLLSLPRPSECKIQFEFIYPKFYVNFS